MGDKNTFSCFAKSLLFVKQMMEEDMFKTIHETDFISQFCDQVDFELFSTDEKNLFNREMVFQKNPHLREYAITGFYNNLFASFKLFYEIDSVLDHIIYENLNFERAEELMNYCFLLEGTNTNVMMSIDGNIHYTHKYSLANSIYIMAKEIYDELYLVHTVLNDDECKEAPGSSDVVELTEYDESVNRLSCKYIRNGIAVLKFFHILALIQVSPFFSDGVHQIASNLIQELRDVLYDKRIMKFIVEQDTYNNSQKTHKTTRVKILFFMKNDDKFCIRLDLPHDEEKNIHLNLNEPPQSEDTAFPFNGKCIDEARRICGDQSIFDNLFFKMDDMFWFKNDFECKRKSLEKADKDNEVNRGKALKKFFHDRGHISVLPSDLNDTHAATVFSEALAEGLMQLGINDVYGATEVENDDFFQYVLLQDRIFESIIRLRNIEKISSLGLNLGQKESDPYRDKIHSLISNFIREKYSFDENLISITQLKLNYCDFVSKCLDYLDNIIC